MQNAINDTEQSLFPYKNEYKGIGILFIVPFWIEIQNHNQDMFLQYINDAIGSMELSFVAMLYILSERRYKRGTLIIFINIALLFAAYFIRHFFSKFRHIRNINTFKNFIPAYRPYVYHFFAFYKLNI